MHPVIQMFLAMKWRRISFYTNMNLILYLLFVVFLTAYIFSAFGGQSLRQHSFFQMCLSNSTKNMTGMLFYSSTTLKMKE